MTLEPLKPESRKRRPRQPEFRFEKHYCEPMTEQEFDELCDLIAEMIFEKMKKDAETKAASGPRTEREQNGQTHRERNEGDV